MLNLKVQKILEPKAPWKHNTECKQNSLSQLVVLKVDIIVMHFTKL